LSWRKKDHDESSVAGADIADISRVIEHISKRSERKEAAETSRVALERSGKIHKKRS
jgi:hypothetical protein